MIVSVRGRVRVRVRVRVTAQLGVDERAQPRLDQLAHELGAEVVLHRQVADGDPAGRLQRLVHVLGQAVQVVRREDVTLVEAVLAERETI